MSRYLRSGCDSGPQQSSWPGGTTGGPPPTPFQLVRVGFMRTIPSTYSDERREVGPPVLFPQFFGGQVTRRKIELTRRVRPWLDLTRFYSTQPRFPRLAFHRCNCTRTHCSQALGRGSPPRTPSEHRVTRRSGSSFRSCGDRDQSARDAHDRIREQPHMPAMPPPACLPPERCFDLPSWAITQPPDSRRQHRRRPFDGLCWVLVLGVWPGREAADRGPCNPSIKRPL